LSGGEEMNFDEVYQQLEDAVGAVVDLLDSVSSTATSLKDKEQQLSHIEKTLRQFKDKTIPIPDELRNFKLKLVMEIDHLRQQMIFKDNVTRLMQNTFPSIYNSSTIKTKQTKRKRRKAGGRVTLQEMIDTKTIQPDQEIYAILKGNVIRAKITHEGQIKIHSTGQCFDSPSSAGVAVTNNSVNGWTFWFIKEGNKSRDLDYYRTQHKKIIKRGEE
jgi:hypothetical protein